jgi:hypothetical protein
MRKVLSMMGHFFVETISLPSLIRQIWKYTAASLDFVVSFGRALFVAVFTDPLIFMLTAGILLWMYLDEFLAQLE